jgi:hypothetical protein
MLKKLNDFYIREEKAKVEQWRRGDNGRVPHCIRKIASHDKLDSY